MNEELVMRDIGNEPAKKKKYFPRQLISQQTIFGAVVADLGYEEYVENCNGNSLTPVCLTYFKNCRTRFLKAISEEYRKQQTLFQDLVARLPTVSL